MAKFDVPHVHASSLMQVIIKESKLEIKPYLVFAISGYSVQLKIKSVRSFLDKFMFNTNNNFNI